MNYLDIIIIIAVIYGGWSGFRKGFVIELFTFMALFLGLYAGIHLSDVVAKFLKEQMNFTSEYLPAISFTITFLAIGAMVYFAGKMFEKIIKIAHLSLLNRIGGAAFGVAKWTFIAGAVIVIGESYDDKTDVISEDTKENSLLFTPIRELTMGAIPAFTRSTIFLKNTLDNKDLLPKHDEADAE